MTEAQIRETLEALVALGGSDTMVGILRALSKGLLTTSEFNAIEEWACTHRGIPRNWYRVLVWSA